MQAKALTFAMATAATIGLASVAWAQASSGGGAGGGSAGSASSTSPSGNNTGGPGDTTGQVGSPRPATGRNSGSNPLNPNGVHPAPGSAPQQLPDGTPVPRR
jgi:hypothetical protein